MAYVRFKPVCNCGYTFNDFTYNPSQREELMNKEKKIIGFVRQSYDCLTPCHCPNCGEHITSFSIPVFDHDGKIIYRE